MRQMARTLGIALLPPWIASRQGQSPVCAWAARRGIRGRPDLGATSSSRIGLRSLWIHIEPAPASERSDKHRPLALCLYSIYAFWRKLCWGMVEYGINIGGEQKRYIQPKNYRKSHTYQSANLWTKFWTSFLLYIFFWTSLLQVEQIRHSSDIKYQFELCQVCHILSRF